MIDRHHGWNVSFKPLVIGLILSLIFSVAAYRIVTHYHLPHDVLTFTIVGLGTLQAIIQLVFFLHLGLESDRPRWNLMMFLFGVLVMFLVIGGSLWIMHNLRYNVMNM